MTTMVIYAQDIVVLSSGTAGINNESGPIALNLDLSEVVEFESPSSSSTPESANTGLQIETIQKKEDLSFALTASSEPAEESIILSIDEFDGLSYKLSDLDGRILEAKQIVSVETFVEFIYLIPSDYFIEVSSEEGSLKTFKVIKK